MNLDDMIEPSAPTRKWSDLQLAIFDSLGDNLIIEAVAGSGKSTTIIECMNRTPGQSIFLAFNKAIADDLRSKVRGAEVKTLNGLGHHIVTRRLPGIKLESWKTANHTKSILNTEEYTEFGSAVNRLVSLAKGNAFGVLTNPSREAFLALADTYEIDIPFDKIARATTVATTVFGKVIEDFTSFDFDDQLFLPVFHNWNFPTFDTVFVDEAQDLNAIQHMMLDRLAGNGAKIVAVGDTRQAIYGFRGALTSSMAALKEDFNMKELPLSTTYRCDQLIVDLAQTIVPQIQARPEAGRGQIDYLSYVSLEEIDDKTMVVCRNNAPLFGLAVQAIQQRRPVRMLSNFTESLKGFIRSFKTQDKTILLDRLEKWYGLEYAKAEEAGFLGRLQFLTDKRDCVVYLAHGCEDVGAMLNALERLTQSTFGPTLSTIHKAKGLEAETTIILNRELMPSRFAQTQQALYQEDNLFYVAVTRAKHKLGIHIQGM